MALWRAILLVNLALTLGVFGGYLAWGRHVSRLEQEITLTREQLRVWGREGTWTVRAVVRAVLPDSGVVVLTHEEIRGYMPAMTMGFRVHEPQLYQGLDIGIAVRVTLKGMPPNLLITAIQRDDGS